MIDRLIDWWQTLPWWANQSFKILAIVLLWVAIMGLIVIGAKVFGVSDE